MSNVCVCRWNKASSKRSNVMASIHWNCTLIISDDESTLTGKISRTVFVQINYKIIVTILSTLEDYPELSSDEIPFVLFPEILLRVSAFHETSKNVYNDKMVNKHATETTKSFRIVRMVETKRRRKYKWKSTLATICRFSVYISVHNLHNLQLKMFAFLSHLYLFRTFT